MNADMKAYIYLTLVNKLIGPLSEENNAKTVSEIVGFTIKTKDLEYITREEPHVFHMVNAMLSMGFSPTFIAQYLHITPATVSLYREDKPREKRVPGRYRKQFPYTNMELSRIKRSLEDRDPPVFTV